MFVYKLAALKKKIISMEIELEWVKSGQVFDLAGAVAFTWAYSICKLVYIFVCENSFFCFNDNMTDLISFGIGFIIS